MPIRVLLVDDSAVIRGLMNKALSADEQIIIVGTAANGEMALHTTKLEKPDVIILDIEMPVMDGITALPKLLEASPKSRVIMASTLTQRNAEISMQALSLGAADYLAKPSSKFGQDVDEFYRELILKIHALSGHPVPKKLLGGSTAPKADAPAANVVETKVETPRPARVTAIPIAAPTVVPKAPAVTYAPSKEPLTSIGIKALAIASSTGGPQALLSLFEQISGRLTNVPILITQHMPPTFTAILAEHLAKAGKRTVLEAKPGMVAEPGCAYVAPGDYHMVFEKGADNSLRINTNQDPQENFCRPAADPMLRSLSKIYGKHLLVLVLTGMGQDGMEGSRHVIAAGGHVIAQDEASCVVYGMPRAVAENNLCRAILPLPEIGRFLIQNIEGR